MNLKSVIKKYNPCLLVISLAPILSWGQSVSGTVISTAGQQGVLPSGEILSYSVGETIISSENQDLITNLGFQQGGLLITAIEDKSIFEELSNNWIVFPNPSSTYFTIQNTSIEFSEEEWNFKLMDASGREILKGQIENGTPFQQSVDQLAAGPYILTLYSNSGKQKSFKLQHQHCFN
jgi:hypothetical protein